MPDPIIQGKATLADQVGVYGEAQEMNAVRGVTYAAGHAAIAGISDNHTPKAGPGIYGQSDATGVWGVSQTWHGVAGQSMSTTGGAGIYGENKTGGPGAWGVSSTWHGTVGQSASTVGGAGIYGEGQASGHGVWGVGKTGHGVYGQSSGTSGGAGVFGENNAEGPGVVGLSRTWHGTFGRTESTVGGAGVAGEHAGNGPGVLASSAHGTGLVAKGGALAARFEGNVEVTGDVSFPGADCAEDFDVAKDAVVEPGTVVVLDEAGALTPCEEAYDRRVAGIVSGAGSYRPALVLDRGGPPGPLRAPVALVGKVYCKVDAAYGPVVAGDLLTTSPTSGHAMRAGEPARAFGAILGKALRPLPEGRDLIPVLVALQ